MRQRLKPARAWSAEAADIVARSNDCRRAVDALIAHLREPSVYREPDLDGFAPSRPFTELETKAIWTIALKTKKQRFESFDERKFAAQMDKTAPVIDRPRVTETALDLWRWLSQPELIRLWGKWNGRPGSRGSDPGYFAKALLLVTATFGKSPWFYENYKHLIGTSELRIVFDRIEKIAATVAGRPRQPFTAPSRERPEPFPNKRYYRKAMAQVAKIVNWAFNRGLITVDDVVRTNITLLKQLAAFYPDTCVRLALDATDITAWVQQIPRRPTPEQERQVRRRAKKASYRVLDRNGKVFKKWRGYYLYVLVDIATNRPVTWCLFPAAEEEHSPKRALEFLLNDLYEKWGDDCPVKYIVADRAWDDVEAISMCATDFGIHLIVDRDESSWNRKPTKLSRKESEVIDRFDGRGVAYCRKHNRPMRRSTARFVGQAERRRLGLKPGEPANPREFRLRLECQALTDPCQATRFPQRRPAPGVPSKVHLHMDRDWAALSAFPHTIDGAQEAEHAFRLAMYARRNSAESLNSALKTFHKLGLEGAVRTRTDNEPVVDLLISLALLSRTASAVADARERHGLSMPDPPAELLTDATVPPLAA